jgi:urea transporter
MTAKMKTKAKLNIVNAVKAAEVFLFGFSQVMLQNNAATGAAFALGVAVSSPFAFLYGLIGSLSGALAALAIAQSFSVANAGLLGFNAVLSGIALAGTKLAATKKIVFALSAIALSVIISFAAFAYGFPALTAPFVVATWIALALEKRF